MPGVYLLLLHSNTLVYTSHPSGYASLKILRNVLPPLKHNLQIYLLMQNNVKQNSPV